MFISYGIAKDAAPVKGVAIIPITIDLIPLKNSDFSVILN
jgi:hypothetical protein